MNNHGLRIWILLFVIAAALIGAGERLLSPLRAQSESTVSGNSSNEKLAVVITCHDMIDKGLYDSIKRRGDEAVKMGADYLILEVQTYGGRVDSADDISKYLILDLADKIHTVAYVSTEAISAGSMISVSCRDIIMRENTTIGCSAPIIMGDSEMGEAEREKTESFVRATFSRAAQANGYPEALLKAMVSQKLEVWQLKNRQTGQMEFFEKEYLPTDPNAFDIQNKKLIVKEGELLTLTDKEALEYGIARAVVDDIEGAVKFLEQRDQVEIADKLIRMETMWSEEMVRWINSPVVSSLLVLGILIGIYVELNTPGLGLPSLLAIACLAILVGSKYLVGLANWIEIAVVCVGIILLMLEIFVIPGFGVAGLLGILFIVGGLLAMWVKNAPGEIPWPDTTEAWSLFTDGLFSICVGFILFVLAAVLIAFNMDRLPLLRRFVLKSSVDVAKGITVSASCPAREMPQLKIGQIGTAVGALRPAGKVRFDKCVVDAVSDGDFIDRDTAVQIIIIHGNHVVVTACSESEPPKKA